MQRNEFFTPANEVWGKVIFLHLFVILFTGGGCVWSRGVCLVWGGALSWGVCLVSGAAWSGGAVWSRGVCSRGCLVPGGVCLVWRDALSWGVCLVSGGAWSGGGFWSWGVCSPGGAWSQGGVPGLEGALSWGGVPGPGVPGPGGSAPEGGAWWRPAPGRPLLRAVRILLECIIVTFIFKVYVGLQFQSGSFISITGYYWWLRLLNQGQLLTLQLTLYSPKPQPSLRQFKAFKPFANDNETNAHKSY